MSDDFYAEVGRALRSKGFERRGHDPRARLVLLRASHGAYIGLYYLGQSAAHWGPYESICKAMRAQSARRRGLTFVIVLVSGDLGYVVDEPDFEKHHRMWSVTNAGKRNAFYHLNDETLKTFPMFRGAEACARLVQDVSTQVPPCRDDLTVDIFRRPRPSRRSKWFAELGL